MGGLLQGMRYDAVLSAGMALCCFGAQENVTHVHQVVSVALQLHFSAFLSHTKLSCNLIGEHNSMWMGLYPRGGGGGRLCGS